MATLTGKIIDVTSRPPDSISSITVKAPSARIGSGTEVITSSPATVDFNSSTGDITISDLTGGLSWLYIEGDGWSDSIALAVAEGMITLVEAIANAAGIPGLVDLIALLLDLQNRIDEIAQDAVDEAAADIMWVKRALGSGENLNDLRSPGLHPVLLGSTMSSLVNRPVGFTNNGYLEVKVSLGTVFQELSQSGSRGIESVKRHTTGGVFGDWTVSEAKTRRLHYSDYNDIPEGTYDIWTFAEARDMANRPPDVPASAVVFVRRAGDGRMYQLVIGTDVNGVANKWERRKSAAGIWSEWAGVHTDVSRAQVESMISAAAMNTVDTSKVVTVGDSQVGASYAWANLLAATSGLTVINDGVGGYTPDEALVSTGVRAMKTISPVSLPPATDVPVEVVEPPIVAKNRSRAWVGTINGYSVEFKYSDPLGTFALRNRGNSTIDVPAGSVWVASTAGSNPDHRRIVWFGGNAIRQGMSQPWETPAEHVMRAYSDAISAWGETTIVCGYVPAHGDTAGRDAANEINTWLARVVPTQFLDMRYRIQQAAEDILGREMTSAEQQDIADGYLPRPLYRSDLVHLTDETHSQISEIVAGFPKGATPALAMS